MIHESAHIEPLPEADPSLRGVEETLAGYLGEPIDKGIPELVGYSQTVPFKATVGSWHYHDDDIPDVIRTGFILQDGKWMAGAWAIDTRHDMHYMGEWWGAAAVRNDGSVVYGVNEDPSGGAEGKATISFFCDDRDALHSFLVAAGFADVEIEVNRVVTRVW